MLKFTIEAMFASVTLFMLLQAWGVYTRETLWMFYVTNIESTMQLWGELVCCYFPHKKYKMFNQSVYIFGILFILFVMLLYIVCFPLFWNFSPGSCWEHTHETCAVNVLFLHRCRCWENVQLKNSMNTSFLQGCQCLELVKKLIVDMVSLFLFVKV